MAPNIYHDAERCEGMEGLWRRRVAKMPDPKRTDEEWTGRRSASWGLEPWDQGSL